MSHERSRRPVNIGDSQCDDCPRGSRASGNEAAARAALGQLAAVSAKSYVPPWYFALLHVSLGDHDRAVESLGRAFEERSPFLVYLQTEAKLDKLRSDARFADLVRRVGFSCDHPTGTIPSR
jgi:hypothetical protein